MKTTLEIPDDLFREAKAKAALEGIKLKDLVARGLKREVWGEARVGKKRRRASKPEPLVHDFNKLPLIEGKPGSPVLDLTAERIHELEMEAELERHDASLLDSDFEKFRPEGVDVLLGATGNEEA